MKKMSQATIAILLTTITSLPAFSNGPACYLNTSPVRSITQASSSVHAEIREKSIYDDFRSVCLEALSELNIQLKMAHDEWKFGSSVSAVERLHQALKVAAESVVFDSVDIPPHAATTIIHSYRIAEKLKSSTQRNISDQGLTLQVEFMMLTELVNTVNWANVELDNPYYRDIIDSYFSYDRNFTRMNFSRDYLLKVKSLSIKFLDVFRDVQAALVTDRVELDVAHSFAFASKTTLNQSLYRRKYCSAIASLDRVMELIEGFQCSTAKIPSYRQVDIVRNALEDLSYEIRNTDNYRCY